MRLHGVFITGGTGYIGQRVIPQLLQSEQVVCALVRKGSEGRLPPGCTPVVGDALDGKTFAHLVRPAETFVQLVGVAHPGPSKAEEFKRIDLASVRASVQAAAESAIRHFIYISVAHPSPIMKAYQEVRIEGERLIRESGLNATILRPWYVLGPGHRWPYALIPLYRALEQIASTREQARRLGLVTLAQMVDAIVRAVANPPDGIRVVEVPGIRAG